MKQRDKNQETRRGNGDKNRKGKGIRRIETSKTNQRVGFEREHDNINYFNLTPKK